MLYVEPLIKCFNQHANAKNASAISAYMKNKFEFFGIKNPDRKLLQKRFIDEYGWPDTDQIESVVKALWKQPQRECQYFAIEILEKFMKKANERSIILYEYLVVTGSWWDTVDTIATKPVGTYFKLFPEKTESVTAKWMKSGNIWLQRVCLLYQLKYKKTTDTKLLSHFILQLNGSKEFFINKAIGWILREYSKTDPQWVRDFLKNNTLAPLSVREGSKYI